MGDAEEMCCPSVRCWISEATKKGDRKQHYWSSVWSYLDDFGWGQKQPVPRVSSTSSVPCVSTQGSKFWTSNLLFPVKPGKGWYHLFSFKKIHYTCAWRSLCVPLAKSSHAHRLGFQSCKMKLSDVFLPETWTGNLSIKGCVSTFGKGCVGVWNNHTRNGKCNYCLNLVAQHVRTSSGQDYFSCWLSPVTRISDTTSWIRTSDRCGIYSEHSTELRMITVQADGMGT